MDSTDPKRFKPNVVLHPGETILEYLDFHGWSQRDLARRTDLTPKTICDICKGKASISPKTALAFEKAFQRPAHLWLNMQLHFDEAKVRVDQFAKSAQWHQWVQNFPLKEMKQLRFSLPTGGSDADNLLNFLGVSSPESWNSVWKATSVAYRQTRALRHREEPIAVWVREAEIVAQQLAVSAFDEQRLFSSFDKLRRLTRSGVDEGLETAQNICAAAGVAVVLVPELKGVGISGCARWLTEKKALLGLTLRYKTDDQLWFTFFHELGHILLHRNKRPFVVDNAKKDLFDRVIDPEMQQHEGEASRFSADTLIPPSALGDFIRRGIFTNKSIHDFAEDIGIGPGIVVGRLQFDGLLARHQGNKLKQQLNWKFADER